MDYHGLAGGVVWEDEGLNECHPDLENAFRLLINHRTDLIVNETIETRSSNRLNRQIFNTAKQYFPDWIGFQKARCTYNSELSDRIKRIRKVSESRIDRLINEADPT